jgi:surfeit locus 1 family protein
MDYRVNEKRRFWLLSTATLLALGATLSLGLWQLSRAAYKESLQSQIEASEKMPAVGGAELLAAAEPHALLHRPVVLQGQWLADKTIFLDNRPMRGKTGFYVLTPLLIAGSRNAVLVQRGWLIIPGMEAPALPSPG